MGDNITPFVPERSSRRFYVPPTVQTDFTNFINTEVPEVTFNFEV